MARPEGADGMGQLPLALRLEKHALFGTFVAGRNGALVALLEAVAAGERSEILWLHGPLGAGKTHLLQAVCRRAGEAGLRSMYLPLDAEQDRHPDQLLGMEHVDVLAVDAVTAVAGEAQWETRLFSAWNQAYERRSALLLAAETPPGALPFSLPDVASRAAGAVVYRLHALDEAEQLAALVKHASHRGLVLDLAAARFLQSRVRRGMRELCAWLDRLDQASLAAQRRLTIPFIREALARAGDDRA